MAGPVRQREVLGRDDHGGFWSEDNIPNNNNNNWRCENGRCVDQIIKAVSVPPELQVVPIFFDASPKQIAATAHKTL